jgi:Holliday junction resolvasome RuvABC endonuclease subunit
MATKDAPLVLGIDPGMANFGWALLKLEQSTESVVLLGVLRTEKTDTKQKVLASDDNVRRLRLVAQLVLGLTESENVVAICLESMSFPRSSSAAAKMAMTWGVVTTVAELRGIPMFQASPQQIKAKVCGKKDASKDAVEAAIRKRHPEADALMKLPPSVQNHAWDAVAAAVTCLDSESILMIRKLTK